MKKKRSKPAKATDSRTSRIKGIPQEDLFPETVIESLTHPFYVIDASDYTIKMANSAARLGAITGTATCHALTHKTDRPCGMDNHPCPLEIVKATKKPAKVEHVHYDKDGNTRNVEVHGFPIFDSKGNVVQMIEYCLDITERKRAEQALRQSEQRYRLFVQNFQGILYQGYLNFVPVFFHGAVEEITGYKEGDFVAGRPRWDQVIHPDDLPGISETAQKVRVTPGYAAKREYRIVRKDGGIRWVHELIQNVCDDSGKPNLVQGALYDITDRKKMEEDLLRHREHLEELVEARTAELRKVNRQLLEENTRRRSLERELLSVVERERQRTGRELHDGIGQQLTGIAFMVETLGQKLSEKSLSEEAAYTEKINRRIQHAAEQTHTLVKGLQPIDLERSGLASALQDLAADTEELFNVSCTFMCTTPVRAAGVTVATNLYRIAQEAITNAIKHGKTRRITIALDGGQEALTLQVDNDGSAFPAGESGGKGMGLNIMRYRAEMIEGSLDIREGSNGGTSVTCVVPNKTHA